MFDTNARMQLQPIRTQADFHDRRFARDRSDDEALIRRSGSIQYPLESFALLIFFVHPRDAEILSQQQQATAANHEQG